MNLFLAFVLGLVLGGPVWMLGYAIWYLIASGNGVHQLVSDDEDWTL